MGIHVSSKKYTKTIFITGGAGYIGSSTALGLAGKNYNLVLIDNKPVTHWHPCLKTLKCIQTDIRDSEQVSRLFHTYKPNAVIHTAALCSVTESSIIPYKYFQTNVIGTMNILNAMHVYGCKHIIFSSTCAVYGNQRGPINEDAPMKPLNVYSTTKKQAEELITWWSNIYDISFVILRYFNIAGSLESAQVGENGNAKVKLIPALFATALFKHSPFILFGASHPTPDGSAVRDYVHISDVVYAHILSLRYLFGGNTSTTLNISSGVGHSNLKILKTIEKITHSTIPYKIKPPRSEEVSQIIGNPTKAKKILMWKPKHSQLQTILRSSQLWFSKYPTILK